jgi:hypothetical protein
MVPSRGALMKQTQPWLHGNCLLEEEIDNKQENQKRSKILRVKEFKKRKK